MLKMEKYPAGQISSISGVACGPFNRADLSGNEAYLSQPLKNQPGHGNSVLVLIMDYELPELILNSFPQMH